MTEQPTTSETDRWIAQAAAVTNWGPWPIADPDAFVLFSSEHAAALAWIGTRGLDINRTPIDPTLEYGVDEQGRRTVTVELFALAEDGRRKVLDEKAGRYVRESVTVLDEPTGGAA